MVKASQTVLYFVLFFMIWFHQTELKLNLTELKSQSFKNILQPYLLSKDDGSLLSLQILILIFIFYYIIIFFNALEMS